MDLALKGKTALVMGASAGIGFAIAKELAAEGARVAICSRDQGRVTQAAAEIGATPFVADLSKPLAAKSLVEEVQKKFAPVDILVTNSGGPPRGAFLELTNAQWETQFTNLWMSVVDSVRAVIPPMQKKKWGRIIFVTSVAAREALPNLTISNGYRAGLLGLMKTLSNEFASDGITINALLPGYTRTERLTETGRSLDEMARSVPAKRIGEPEELAAVAAFLASGRASYVCGQAIAVDGGYLKGI